MKTPRHRIPLLIGPIAATAAALALSASASAASLFLDFQGGGTGPVTQDGATAFVRAASWAAAGESEAQNFTLGTDTITVSAFAHESGGAAYNRTGATQTNAAFDAYEFNDLLRDGLQRIREYNADAPIPDPTATALSISGLSTSTQYEVRFWLYDPGFANGTTFTYYDLTGTPSSFGSITNDSIASGNASFPDRNAYSVAAYSVAGTFTPSVTGTLSFGIDSDDSGQLPKISGMEIIVIPEPSSALMLVGGLGTLLLLRRRTGR